MSLFPPPRPDHGNTARLFHGVIFVALIIALPPLSRAGLPSLFGLVIGLVAIANGFLAFAPRPAK